MKQMNPLRRCSGATLAAMLGLLAVQAAAGGRHDAESSCKVESVRVLASFDPAGQELPDSVAVLRGHGRHGTPVVGFNPKGQVALIAPNGGYSAWSTFSPFAAVDRLTGLDADRDGTLYISVASFAPAVPGEPLPGIYKVPPGGGAPVRHSLPSTPAMTLPNGIELVRDDLYVADSNGYLFKVDAAGNTTLWSDHPALLGNQAACPVPLPTPRPFGANGIAYHRHSLYVTNFDHGAVLRFPILRDGSAGKPQTLVRSCDYQGIKGIAVDERGVVLFNRQFGDTLHRIGRDGEVTTLLAGKPPLDQPGHMRLDGWGQRERLLVPNFARNAVLANDNPLVQLLSIELGDCRPDQHGHGGPHRPR